MLLEIMEGQESYISAEKLQDKNYFMYPAYYSALLALINTVKQRRRWEQQISPCRQNPADYGMTNIITFAAPRGGGKTSAMLSFAAAMERPERFLDSGMEDCEVLRGAVFLSLPLIVPSVLRSGQGILPVVLSRMYQLAEKLWQDAKSPSDQSRPYCQNGPTEVEKSELLYHFQQCLSGINAIKSPDGTTMDLSRLHELSDGASLRQSFHLLIQRLLRFAGCPDGFLVLQLDDADSQVGQGYEMLEDIRKYLMLPNLIILMAADFPMLRTVVLKHHCVEFQDALKHNLMGESELKSLTGKYLDKLIPPLNLVYLPRLEQYSAQYGDSFQLRYLRDQELVWESTAGISFQSQILARIHQKTGMTFVSHTSYQNNIIPTTLRGLKQLLEILDHMPDIPEVREADKKTAAKLAVRVEKQAKIASENLARFSDYFIQDWISVKVLGKEDRAFLNRLAQSPATDRLQLIRDHLEERCYEMEFTCPSGDYSHAAIAQCLEEVGMKSRRQEDYLFSFAIRTILSLDCHRRVWHQKERAAVQCKEEKQDLLLFPLIPERTGISDTYYIYTGNKELHASEIFTDGRRGFELLEEWPLKDAVLTNYLLSWRGDMLSISYMHILNLFLYLGISGLRQFVPQHPKMSDQSDGKTQQCILYNAQEAALFVASNWEVQRRLLVDWDMTPSHRSHIRYGESEKADNTSSIIHRIFSEMDEDLKDLNQGTVWKKSPSEGLTEAFRALCTGVVIDDLDFVEFYDKLCTSMKNRD